jgi:hypothetical protein
MAKQKIFIAPEDGIVDFNNGQRDWLARAHRAAHSDAEGIEKYGSRFTDFARVDRLEDADFGVFPFKIEAYVKNDAMQNIVDMSQQAHAAGKKMLLWIDGDQGLSPRFHRPGLVVLTQTTFRSWRTEQEFVVPHFADDMVEIYKSGHLPIREKSTKPVIGFCGQARLTTSRLAWQTYLGTRRRAEYLARLSPYAPSHIRPGIILRSKVLNLLEADDRIETNFILRKTYKAGIKGKARNDLSHPSRVEFAENIFGTDYTVCVRGGGNWSMRLFETLSCGRIPIFIDTDCILPFDFKINWRDYCVFIENHEIPHVAEKVHAFHSSITDQAFRERQTACREFWLSHLSKDGFFEHVGDHVDKTVQDVKTVYDA